MWLIAVSYVTVSWLTRTTRAPSFATADPVALISVHAATPRIKVRTGRQLPSTTNQRASTRGCRSVDPE